MSSERSTRPSKRELPSDDEVSEDSPAKRRRLNISDEDDNSSLSMPSNTATIIHSSLSAASASASQSNTNSDASANAPTDLSSHNAKDASSNAHNSSDNNAITSSLPSIDATASDNEEKQCDISLSTIPTEFHIEAHARARARAIARGTSLISPNTAPRSSSPPDLDVTESPQPIEPSSADIAAIQSSVNRFESEPMEVDLDMNHPLQSLSNLSSPQPQLPLVSTIEPRSLSISPLPIPQSPFQSNPISDSISDRISDPIPALNPMSPLSNANISFDNRAISEPPPGIIDSVNGAMNRLALQNQLHAHSDSRPQRNGNRDNSDGSGLDNDNDDADNDADNDEKHDDANANANAAVAEEGDVKEDGGEGADDVVAPPRRRRRRRRRRHRRRRPEEEEKEGKENDDSDDEKEIPPFFSCGVCHDLYYEPVTLPCGHSYCELCVLLWWRGRATQLIRSCPQCRDTSSTYLLPRADENRQGQTGLPRAVALRDAIQHHFPTEYTQRHRENHRELRSLRNQTLRRRSAAQSRYIFGLNHQAVAAHAQRHRQEVPAPIAAGRPMPYQRPISRRQRRRRNREAAIERERIRKLRKELTIIFSVILTIAIFIYSYFFL